MPTKPRPGAARRRAALVEDLEWMARHGETLDGAANRLGITRDTLIVTLSSERRIHRPDLLQHLRANAGDPVTCIRRPGTTWTKCRCPSCARDRARMDKLHSLGRWQREDPDKAWATFTRYLDDGWSASAIADAHGIAPKACQAAASVHRKGGTRRFGHRYAGLLNAGPAQRPVVGLVPAAGSQRRLQALALAGYGLPAIAERTEISWHVLREMQLGRHRRVKANAAAAIADAYEVMRDEPGWSDIAQSRAKRLGFFYPAAAWDDATIDDPRAQPRAEPLVTKERRIA